MQDLESRRLDGSLPTAEKRTCNLMEAGFITGLHKASIVHFVSRFKILCLALMSLGFRVWCLGFRNVSYNVQSVTLT